MRRAYRSMRSPISHGEFIGRRFVSARPTSSTASVAFVVSGDEKLTKPDPAIYRLALKRWGLRAEDCIFIDDRADNVAGAESVGIDGVVFTDAGALRKALSLGGVRA